MIIMLSRKINVKVVKALVVVCLKFRLFFSQNSMFPMDYFMFVKGRLILVFFAADHTSDCFGKSMLVTVSDQIIQTRIRCS